MASEAAGAELYYKRERKARQLPRRDQTADVLAFLQVHGALECAAGVLVGGEGGRLHPAASEDKVLAAALSHLAAEGGAPVPGAPALHHPRLASQAGPSALAGLYEALAPLSHFRVPREPEGGVEGELTAEGGGGAGARRAAAAGAPDPRPPAAAGAPAAAAPRAASQ